MFQITFLILLITAKYDDEVKEKNEIKSNPSALSSAL